MGGHFKFDKRKQDTVTLRQCIEALEKAAEDLYINSIYHGWIIKEYTEEEFTIMKIREWMGDLERKETSNE